MNEHVDGRKDNLRISILRKSVTVQKGRKTQLAIASK